MFIGHFAVSFAAKRAAPPLSLGTLFLAAQFADLLWPNLVLAGLESFVISPGVTAMTPLDFVSYPYSHSLVSLVLFGALAGVLYRAYRRDTTAAAVLALVVVSHWILDAITHRPDMPIGLVDRKVGLGLWNSVPATVAVECAMFLGALLLYARATHARDRIGSVGLWGLVVFLLVIYAANVFSPPPPSVSAVAWSAQAMWLLVAWAYWIDRHRAAAPA